MNLDIKIIALQIFSLFVFTTCFSGCVNNLNDNDETQKNDNTTLSVNSEQVLKDTNTVTTTEDTKADDPFPILNSKYFHDNIAILYYDDRAHYVNNYGKYLDSYPFYDYADKEYSPLHNFHDGLTAAWKRYKKGGRHLLDCYYVDTSGRIAIDEKFGYNGNFEDGYAITILKNNDNKHWKKSWCLINKSGKHIIEADGISDRYQNLIWIKKSNEFRMSGDWGLARIDTIDDSYEMIVDFKYNIIGQFIKGVCWVEKITERGEFEGPLKQRALMNSEGELITPWYDNLYTWSTGLSTFTLMDKYGVLDISGNVVMEAQNDYTKAKEFATKKASKPNYNFNEGYAVVHKNGKYGFIDSTNKLVIGYKYDKISKIGFSGGVAKVQLGEDEFFINKKEECLIGCIPRKKLPTPDSTFISKLSGNELIDAEIIAVYIQEYFPVTKEKTITQRAKGHPEMDDGQGCRFSTEYGKEITIENDYGCRSYDRQTIIKFNNYSFSEVRRILKILLPFRKKSKQDEIEEFDYEGWDDSYTYYGYDGMCSMSIIQKGAKIIVTYGCSC